MLTRMVIKDIFTATNLIEGSSLVEGVTGDGKKYIEQGVVSAPEAWCDRVSIVGGGIFDIQEETGDGDLRKLQCEEDKVEAVDHPSVLPALSQSSSQISFLVHQISFFCSPSSQSASQIFSSCSLSHDQYLHHHCPSWCSQIYSCCSSSSR